MIGKAFTEALAARWSDRLNPVLVRDIQQAMRGKFFPIILLLGLLLMLIVTSAVLDKNAQYAGEALLGSSMTLLGVVLVCILPFQAFHAMQREVDGGSSELLLLSKLTPGRIVRGKLYAALAHEVLWISLFAPVMSMTLLLRGVSVVDVLVPLCLLVLASLAATSLAIGFGALARTPQLRIPSFIGLVIALVLAGVTVVANLFRLAMMGTGSSSSEIVRLGIWSVVLAGLFLLAGAAALGHPFENRSSVLRGYLFSITGVLAAACSVSRGTSWVLDPVMTAAELAAIAIPFFIVAATEDFELSPRVRRLVPRNPLLAFLATPFLPGGGRGMTFTCVTALLMLVLFLGLRSMVYPSASALNVMAIMICYAVIYAGLGCTIRRIVGAKRNGARFARILTVLLILFGAVVPLIAAVGDGEPSILRALNPIWTLGSSSSKQSLDLGLLVIGACVFVLLNLAEMIRGFGEVQRASAARRAGAP